MADLWREDVLGEKKRVEAAKDAAIKLEVVKSHMRQSKDGLVVSIVVSPADDPAEINAIMTASIGQRFYCVLVPIDDHEQPVVSKEKKEVEEWIRLCGIICNDVEFQEWLLRQGKITSLSNEEAAQFVRDFCNVSSRAQFRDKPDALKKWRILHLAYIENGEI